jgi:hypothetical protein
MYPLPAALSESVKGDTPYEVKMMGRTVVLFRDENGEQGSCVTIRSV